MKEGRKRGGRERRAGEIERERKERKKGKCQQGTREKSASLTGQEVSN